MQQSISSETIYNFGAVVLLFCVSQGKSKAAESEDNEDDVEDLSESSGEEEDED